MFLCVSVCACVIGICTCSIQGGQKQRSTGVCLVQCSGQRRSTQPSSIIFDINKFLIGLQWGKERQLQQGRAVGQRVEDDTNRSISSIEEDFLTASEHLGDDSEDDGFRNGEPHYPHRRDFVCSLAGYISKTFKQSWMKTVGKYNGQVFGVDPSGCLSILTYCIVEYLDYFLLNHCT